MSYTEQITASINDINASKINIIAVLNVKGLNIAKSTLINDIPEMIVDLISINYMINANGLEFGASSVLVQGEEPTCPNLEQFTGDTETIEGQIERIRISRNNIITVLNTKGITIPTGTQIANIPEYVSQIISKADMTNAKNNAFGSNETVAIVGQGVVGKTIVGRI